MPNFVQYHQYILESDPIAYWLQDEKQGTVSYDWVRRRQGADQDGAYTGVTLGSPGIGDGRTAPFFDGANDFNNIYTATFAGRFNGAEGSVAAWARVNGPGVWIDGTVRRVLYLLVNAANNVRVGKTAANNELSFVYRAGAVTRTVNANSTSTDWMHLAITWSATADEVRAYLNGAQQGATLNGLGVWAGVLVGRYTNIGAYDNVAPSQIWHGYIAHPAVWDRPLPPNEINELYRAAAYVPR